MELNVINKKSQSQVNGIGFATKCLYSPLIVERVLFSVLLRYCVF
ncbi:MAG: hypothetical protein ACI9LG_003480 [Moritella dasanensis]|jgi:hypothetical protein